VRCACSAITNAGKRRADLNLIPLIDVFTVLVFFLLVHPNDGAMLPTAQRLHLPESVAEADPNGPW